jgi:nitrous oxidase accessory protein NosD
MKLVKEHINEKFEEISDPVADMGIGKIDLEKVYNDTVIAGINVAIGRKSGHIVSWGKGIHLYSTYYLTVVQTYNMTARDRYFTCMMFNNIEDAQTIKKRLSTFTTSYLYTAINKVKLYIKKQSFNNRFEIIEAGI